MKKLFIILIIIAILILIIYSIAIIGKKEIVEKESFEDLIKYKTTSISDTKNLDKILNSTELSSYISKKEKITDNGKEKLIIYYDCVDEEKVIQYRTDANKDSITEKNSVILFSLVDNLEKIEYKFTISNEEIKNRYPYGSKDINKEYYRETINYMYNQDVRDYTNKPNEFLKYNMDLNINKISIYQPNFNLGEIEYNKFEISNVEEVNKIKEFIINQNFGIDYGSIDGMIDTVIDFNNGYVIERFGNSDNAIIFKGTAEDIMNNTNLSKGVYKTLPKGLMEYINSLIIQSQL